MADENSTSPFYQNDPRVVAGDGRRRPEPISAATGYIGVALLLITVTGLSFLFREVGRHSPAEPTAIDTHSSRPPPPSTVTQLVIEEARAATTHDIGLVAKIYAPRALIENASCDLPSSQQSWSGLASIEARYQNLGGFSGLRHAHARVTFTPDSGRARRATATAQTVGFFQPAGPASTLVPLHGYEVWTFARVNGRWLVTSFIYDLCRPAD